jgi:hypothetical protein
MLHLLATWSLWRNVASISNVALSLILGLVALAYTALYHDATFLMLQKQAGAIRDWVVTMNSWPKAEIVARLVLHETTILFMFFTMGVRIVLSILTGLIGFIFRR